MITSDSLEDYSADTDAYKYCPNQHYRNNTVSFNVPVAGLPIVGGFDVSSAITTKIILERDSVVIPSQIPFVVDLSTLTCTVEVAEPQRSVAATVSGTTVNKAVLDAAFGAAAYLGAGWRGTLITDDAVYDVTSNGTNFARSAALTAVST